jgi:segregation and condensation protein A
LITASVKEKPFWLNSPWNILFDIFKLQKVKPWDINISQLLDTLIAEMESRGRIDFAASGMALFSSATLYRIKSDLILKLEEPPEVELERKEVYLPPPIQLPYRHEYTTTTINDLIDALERAIKSEMDLKTTIGASESKLEPFYPEASIIESVDKFMVDVKGEVNKLHQRILKLAKENKLVLFSKLTSGQQKIEKIRTFFLILFMACNEMIKLWQSREFSEIYITVDEDADLERAETTTG